MGNAFLPADARRLDDPLGVAAAPAGIRRRSLEGADAKGPVPLAAHQARAPRTRHRARAPGTGQGRRAPSTRGHEGGAARSVP
ncbi:hypothetical protein ACOZCI_03440, partial [Streptomyces griseoincarnatus]